MPGRECYHCKQWVEEGQAHDCWTTTEAALTRDLSDDLQDAYERLRETAVTFGEQRIYASLNSIMFSRKSCYFFVRPKRAYLEVCVFLGRTVKAPQIRKAEPASKTKIVHFIRVTHRDQVEVPLTDWLQEAYELQDKLALRPASAKAAPKGPAKATPKGKAKSATRKRAAASPQRGASRKKVARPAARKATR